MVGFMLPFSIYGYIQVTSSDLSALEIIQTSKGHGSHQYKVQLLKIHPLDETLFVTINSPVSEQSIQVPITSPNVAQKCVNQPLQSMSSALLTVISNLGLIISTLIVLAATVWGTCISHLLICNFFLLPICFPCAFAPAGRATMRRNILAFRFNLYSISI